MVAAAAAALLVPAAGARPDAACFVFVFVSVRGAIQPGGVLLRRLVLASAGHAGVAWRGSQP